MAEKDLIEKVVDWFTPDKLAGLIFAGALAGLFSMYNPNVDKRMVRFDYDRVSRQHALYHEARPRNLESLEDYHPTVERIADLDGRFRERLDINNDRIVTREEFSQFLDTVGYTGRRISDARYYGFCDNPIAHGHSGEVTIENHWIHYVPIPLKRGGDYYDLDPAVVERYLGSE